MDSLGLDGEIFCPLAELAATEKSPGVQTLVVVDDSWGENCCGIVLTRKRKRRRGACNISMRELEAEKGSIVLKKGSRMMIG